MDGKISVNVELLDHLWIVGLDYIYQFCYVTLVYDPTLLFGLMKFYFWSTYIRIAIWPLGD